MVWRNIFRKTQKPDDEPSTTEAAATTGPRRFIPPHIAGPIQERSRASGPQPDPDPRQRRLAGLRRQRLAILFDIEQGELAASPDNPWTNRISLLTEAMTAVGDDLAATVKVEPGTYHPIPETPIAIESVEPDDAAMVEFTVGDAQFSYSEDPDWAERGRQIARSELVRRRGSLDALIPDDTPPSLRDALREHLGDSLFVFASDLRDRKLDGEAMPAAPALADFARPCPVCGGWTDWRGTCQACARRSAALMSLKREESRLLDERAREAEERRRLVEGLPLARKRLRDVNAELARLGEAPA